MSGVLDSEVREHEQRCEEPATDDRFSYRARDGFAGDNSSNDSDEPDSCEISIKSQEILACQILVAGISSFDSHYFLLSRL